MEFSSDVSSKRPDDRMALDGFSSAPTIHEAWKSELSIKDQSPGGKQLMKHLQRRAKTARRPKDPKIGVRSHWPGQKQSEAFKAVQTHPERTTLF